MTRAALVATIAMAACSGSSAPTASPPPASASAPDAALGGPMIAIPTWGVEVEVPAGATSGLAAPDRYVVYLSAETQAVFELVDRAAPRTVAELTHGWGSAERGRHLDEGVTDDGAVFALRSFEIMRGTPGLEGQTIHYRDWVSRVFAAVPLDAQRHVHCIAYLESEADAENPTLRTLMRICLSVRPRPPGSPPLGR